MKKTIIYAVILAVVSLIVGGLVGALIEKKSGYLKRRHFIEGMRERMHDRRESRHEKGENALLGKLTRQLDLTQDQQVKVKAIMDDARKEVETFREKAIKKMKEVRDETNAKIQAILTQEQNKKFTQIISELKNRQDQHRGFGSKEKGPSDFERGHSEDDDNNNPPPPPPDQEIE